MTRLPPPAHLAAMPVRRLVRGFAALLVLACDGGLEPEPATACSAGVVGICGTVRFRGAIPESTDVVYVIAYPSFPQDQSDLFTFQPAAPATPPILALGDTIATYELRVPPGRYEWVLAVWKKIGVLNPATAEDLLRESGFYRDPADTSRAGVVTVAAGGTRDSVDFIVDFDNRHPISYWFPPQR